MAICTNPPMRTSAATPPVRRVCLFADCRRLLEQPAAELARLRREALKWLHERHGELHPSLLGGGPLVVRLRLNPDLALVQGSGEWHDLTVELPAPPCAKSD